jgi:hypothetical protein
MGLAGRRFARDRDARQRRNAIARLRAASRASRPVGALEGEHIGDLGRELGPAAAPQRVRIANERVDLVPLRPQRRC